MIFQGGGPDPLSPPLDPHLETPLLLKAFRWNADECPTINAGLAAAIFQGIRTCIARKPYIMWFFSVGSGPGSARVISRYFGTYNVRERLRRACRMHWWLRKVKHHRFYVEWFINYVSHDLKPQLGKKALLYISLYKQTYLVNLLSCLTLRFAWLF